MSTIAVISDTHDRLDRIALALAAARGRGCETLVHLGDFVAPFAMKAIAQWPGTLYAIYGNNDGERAGLKKILPSLTDGPVIWELEGRKLGAAHSREEVPRAYFSACAAVCFGHSHEAAVRGGNGGALELNPGECCGWLSGRSTMAFLDLERMAAEIVEL
jgi:putative phosphoesterase